MASQCKVQDIKRKFEGMIVVNKPLLTQFDRQLSKHIDTVSGGCKFPNVESESDEGCIKVLLSRQASDPVKKLQRSHAFRCDRNQRIANRQSHSPTSEKGLISKMSDKKLSTERLKLLGNVLEDRMRKENFTSSVVEVRLNSIPDAEVPKHILDQYAKVNKPRNEPKKDSTVDSGVGSETENLDDEKYGQIRKTNTSVLNNSNSEDTIRLEKKNPHVRLTDTLKKALKQPLPLGPPPEKPPRTFVSSPAQEKKSTKHMLEKLEQELVKRETKEREKRNELKKPKELHYMCTEIFDIQQRSLPNPKSENGAIKNYTSTLPEHLNGRNLNNGNLKQVEHTYDTPYEATNPTNNEKPEAPKSNFETIRRTFESGFNNTTNNVAEKRRNTENSTRKPAMQPKVKNLRGDLKYGRKFATDTKRYYRKTDRNERLSLPKKSSNVDVEKETLYRLMDEIYATVKVGNMEDDRIGSSTDGSTTDESVKVTRSLTEKRKNYVRGISSRVAYLDPTNVKTVRSKTTTCTYQDPENPYSTHRSWKSFRTSQKDLSESSMADVADVPSVSSMDDNLSIDKKTGCLDIELCFEPRYKGLYNVCILVGFNFMNSQAYVKSVFPDQVKPPAHIESLIFPETLSSDSKVHWRPDAASTQCYSLVLTDEKGERSYGYCRRVLPEGASACLPLAYCLIGKYRAPGFYYKVLQEIESLHGNSEHEINSILQQLFETDFPEPGEDVFITYTDQILNNTSLKNQLKIADMCRSKTMLEIRRRRRDFSPANETDDVKSLRECTNTVRESSSVVRDSVKVKRKVFSSKRLVNSMVPDYYDLENNNKPKDNCIKKSIKRPLEPRVDEHNLSSLLDSLGAGLTVKVFGSLLLERKVFIISDKLSQVSSCIEALQSSIYPFVWQHTLISIVPAEIQRDMLEAPLPIFAGVLKAGNDDDDNFTGIKFEGMLIDLTSTSKVLFYEGDESTILPTHGYKTLKTSLQMWTTKHRDKQQRQEEDRHTRNVMISEAFLRFFVDIMGDFWKFFSFGEMKSGGLGKGGVVFDKESFVKSATSKQNQHFLEWFTETAMFNHFIKNMAAVYRIRQSEAGKSNADQSQSLDLVDTPLPNFYEVFDERVKSRCKNMNVPSKKNLAFLKNKMRDMLMKFQK